MSFRPGTRDLGLAALVLVGLSRFVDAPVAWILAALALPALALGTLQVLGEDGPAASGVPVEALVVPALAAAGSIGLVRLVPIGPWLVPAVGAAAWLVARVGGLEARQTRAVTGPSAADRTATFVSTLVAAFVAFSGVAVLVPGGLPEPTGTVSPGGAVTIVWLALADGLVAVLAGYRMAAVRTPNARDAAWFALTCALVVATAAAAFRILELPRLLGPALLVLVVFLWDAVHGTPAARKRDIRWIWETALLVVLAVVVLAWGLGARG